MAKKQHSESHYLPLDTKIEVISIKGDKSYKKIMTFGEALNIVKKKGWIYINYQLGFSKFNNENK